MPLATGKEMVTKFKKIGALVTILVTIWNPGRPDQGKIIISEADTE